MPARSTRFTVVLTRAVRLRNSPVRGRGRGPRGPGAGARGAGAAGDRPDLRSPGAVTASTSTLPRRGRQRAEILDALSVKKGERSGREHGRARLREGPHGVVGGTSSPARCRTGRCNAHRRGDGAADGRRVQTTLEEHRSGLAVRDLRLSLDRRRGKSEMSKP